MEPSMNQRTAVLLERVNNNVNNLNKRFESIIQLAPIENKDKHVTASETFQIEVHAAQMIRAAEDLLALSRSLKEAWLFGQLGSTVSDNRPETDADAREVGGALLDWYKKIPAAVAGSAGSM